MDEKELLSELGRRVRARRESMALSQADLANRGGPGEATVSRLERGDGAAPRRQTQQQLEKALALPPGAVPEFLDAHRRALAMAPNIVFVPPFPLGDKKIYVLDESLAVALQDELGYAASPGQTLDFNNVDADGSTARRALLVAGRTPPIYPITLVQVSSGNEYQVDSPADLHNHMATGEYRLKHAIPGLNFAVYDPAAAVGRDQTVTPTGRPSRRRVGQPDVSHRTRINRDGSVERSPLTRQDWHHVGDLGQDARTLAAAAEIVRKLPLSEDANRAHYHLGQVLLDLAEQLDQSSTD